MYIEGYAMLITVNNINNINIVTKIIVFFFYTQGQKGEPGLSPRQAPKGQKVWKNGMLSNSQTH